QHHHDAQHDLQHLVQHLGHFFIVCPSSVCVALNVFVQSAVFVAASAVFLVDRLYSLDEGGLVDVIVDMHAVLLGLGDGVGHHVAVQALEVFVGLFQAGHQRLLLFGGEAVPGGG